MKEVVSNLSNEELRDTIYGISKLPNKILTSEIGTEMQNIQLEVISELGTRKLSMKLPPAHNNHITFGTMIMTDHMRIFTEDPITVQAMLDAWHSTYRTESGYMVHDIDNTPYTEFHPSYERAEENMARIYKNM